MRDEFKEWEEATDEKAAEYFAIGLSVVLAVGSLALLAVLFLGGN